MENYFLFKLRKHSKLKILFDILKILILIYLFLIGIKLLGASLKGFGSGFAAGLIQTTANPFMGLIIGILATSIIQSSSATTSIIVGFVASGVLTITNAIPIVMGANIGTTITNIIISLAHIGRKEEFQKAFPVATVHDMFNLLAVLILLPIEMKFKIIEQLSFKLTNIFSSSGGMKFNSPLTAIVNPTVKWILAVIHHYYVIGAILGFVFVLLALKFLVDVIRSSSKGKLEVLIDGYLFSSPIKSWFLGMGLTAFVQSSSITTSIIVPLAAAGLVNIEQVFPYMLGANIGTTITAILASLVTGSYLAIQIAICHLLFNIFGSIVWYPLKIVPIKMAEKLGDIAVKRRYIAIMYVITVFFVLPILLLLIFRR
jgi:sodium-dependent phosphate cotransporter